MSTVEFLIYPASVLHVDARAGQVFMTAPHDEAEEHYRVALPADAIVAEEDLNDGWFAIIRDGLDGVIASGYVQVAARAELRHPASGRQIRMEMVELDGKLYGYATSEPLVPGVIYTLSDDTGEASVSAFGPGTMVLTPEGEQPVEWLETGARVVTRDHGIQPLAAVLRFSRDPEWYDEHLGERPLEILPGEVDGTLPREAMTVTSSQRFLLRDPVVDLHFGVAEVLVPAQAWSAQDPLRRATPAEPVTFTALVVQRPEIVQIGGLWVEATCPTARAAASLPESEARKLYDLFGPRLPEVKAPRLCLVSEEAPLVVKRRGSDTLRRASTA